MKKSNWHLYSIPEISCEKLEKCLTNIALTKATCSDNIWPKLLKLAAAFIAESLKYICNQSINNSTFPDTNVNGKKAK